MLIRNILRISGQTFARLCQQTFDYAQRNDKSTSGLNFKESFGAIAHKRAGERTSNKGMAKRDSLAYWSFIMVAIGLTPSCLDVIISCMRARRDSGSAVRRAFSQTFEANL